MAQADKLVISKGTIEHVELLTRLSITTFCETFAADNKKEDMDQYIAEEMNSERLGEELKDTGNIFLLAWHDEALVGYAKLRATKIPDQLKNNKPIELERLYVLRPYQDKKVGAAIMQQCVDIAVDNKHDVIWLGVWEHNHKAVRFYKQWGFELFGAHTFKLGNDKQVDILMKKTLRQ